MIQKYISEKIVIVTIYFKNHSNDYQSYITYEFIVPF
jgi:hypothetical protein